MTTYTFSNRPGAKDILADILAAVEASVMNNKAVERIGWEETDAVLSFDFLQPLSEADNQILEGIANNYV